MPGGNRFCTSDLHCTSKTAHEPGVERRWPSLLRMLATSYARRKSARVFFTITFYFCFCSRRPKTRDTQDRVLMNYTLASGSAGFSSIHGTLVVSLRPTCGREKVVWISHSAEIVRGEKLHDAHRFACSNCARLSNTRGCRVTSRGKWGQVI